MKAILYLLLFTAPVGSLLAQGQIQFGNSFGNVSAPVLRVPTYGPDPANPFLATKGNTATGIPAGSQTYGGPLLAGTGYTIALFTQFGDSYVEIARSTFRIGSASGLFTAVTVTDPNHPPGSVSVSAVVRAWDNQGGTITSWAQAKAAPGTPAGESEPFLLAALGGVGPGGQPYTSPRTDGLRSFNLHHSGGAFILAQPEDLIVPAGASAQMSIVVESGGDTPSFQWQRDGTDIPDATDATLSFTNVQYADAGGYSAIVTASSLTLTSRVARLTVQPMIAGIEHFYIPDWGADAIRIAYDSTPLHPVRVEVRSTLRDTWINMGQFVNPGVRAYFFDIGPTNDMRIYRLSIDP